jgi:hypothetical protein
MSRRVLATRTLALSRVGMRAVKIDRSHIGGKTKQS